MTERCVCFPQLGNYYIPSRTLGLLVGDEVMIPPRTTRKTLEIGAKYSPESTCLPFKIMLGNFIEAIELGANVLIQMGGGCRLACYGELHRAILRRLGYEVEFVKVINDAGLLSIVKFIKQLYPYLSYLHIARVLHLAYEQAKAIDEIEDFVRKHIGFETRNGSFEHLHNRFLEDLMQTEAVREVKEVRQQYSDDLRKLSVDKPEEPLRVAFVGEFYVVVEPFSNFFIEKQLAKYGVEVHRPITVTGAVHHYTLYNRYLKHVVADAAPYLRHPIGAHGTESVAQAVRFAKQGFDGLIHVKPFGCMPEINAMPALHRVSEDFRFPILYFSFDSLTSETGIKTRLEAFYDMLMMRRN